MTIFLVATDSVHTTAAAADYLRPRLDETDTVIGLAVTDGHRSERDAGDALNVLPIRFPDHDIETVQRSGDPASTILSVSHDHAVDEIIIGARSGSVDSSGEGLGGTAANVLSEANRPVVVLPLTAVDS